jgi:putative transposase
MLTQNTSRVGKCAGGSGRARFGKPDIFNTDQGSQFTGVAFTGTLIAAGIRISMDGRGRWIDSVFIERVWRSLKHEDIYLKGYADGARRISELPAGLPFAYLLQFDLLSD